MAKLQVAVLFGGKSVEHDISLVSARSIINALNTAKYEIIPLGISKEGEWLNIEASAAMLRGDLRELSHSQPKQLEFALPAVDVVFPILHGTNGEDGTVQGLLELAGIPYVGAGVLASAVGMDKLYMKRLFQHAELPIAAYIAIGRQDWHKNSAELRQQVAGQIGYPCFVKPANGGSSVGVVKVRGPEKLDAAVEQALALDRRALVEQAIIGRELECAVLGNDDALASTVGEIIPKREFYDYEAKYHDDNTELVVPAELPKHLSDAVQALAVRTFRAIDGAGMARVDFFLRRKDDALFVNEINTIPGFTPVSMYPRMWEASGLPYPALLDRLIELAQERHREQRETSFSHKAPQPA